jgi:hypothetical protein
MISTGRKSKLIILGEIVNIEYGYSVRHNGHLADITVAQ